MQGHIFALIAAGFASVFFIGAAGAASDVVYEMKATSPPDILMAIECQTDPMMSEYAQDGTPACSAHRTSLTYGRQVMATRLNHHRQDLE